MPKVINLPEMHKLQIELLDWSFNNHDRSLEIHYYKDEQEKDITLSKEQLLRYLDSSFIIDSFRNEEVTIRTVEDFFDAGEIDGHGQREYADRMNIVEFMNQVLGEEDVNRLVKFHEEQIEVKEFANKIATAIQNTIKQCNS